MYHVYDLATAGATGTAGIRICKNLRGGIIAFKLFIRPQGIEFDNQRSQ